MGDTTKTDKYSEKFHREGGEGVIFNPKKYVADFGPLKRAFSGKKCNMIKGRLELFQKFIRLVASPVPQP